MARAATPARMKMPRNRAIHQHKCTAGQPDPQSTQITEDSSRKSSLLQTDGPSGQKTQCQCLPLIPSRSSIAWTPEHLWSCLNTLVQTILLLYVRTYIIYCREPLDEWEKLRQAPAENTCKKSESSIDLHRKLVKTIAVSWRRDPH